MIFFPKKKWACYFSLGLVLRLSGGVQKQIAASAVGDVVGMVLESHPNKHSGFSREAKRNIDSNR